MHGGGVVVCAGGMRDMRQNFDRFAGLIDKRVDPTVTEKKTNLYQDGLCSCRK